MSVIMLILLKIQHPSLLKYYMYLFSIISFSQEYSDFTRNATPVLHVFNITINVTTEISPINTGGGHAKGLKFKGDNLFTNRNITTCSFDIQL